MTQKFTCDPRLMMTASEESDRSGNVTRLLHAVGNGDEEAFDELMPLVYDELRQLAKYHLRREHSAQAPQTTELVHELYLKLVDQAQIDWNGRAHFFTLAARAMRQILVDHARKRNAKKRGGDWDRTTLSDKPLATDPNWAELLALDDALDRLDAVDTRMRTVVECRFFGGMTEKEIAEVLDVSARTVQRDWVKARAWLYKELYPEERED